MRAFTALLFLALAPLPGLSALDQREAAAVAFVNDHVDEAIALLERAVDINSGTGNHEGVRATGDLFAAELRALGFSTRWVDGAPFGRAGHLVAERPGPGPHVLLIGHLDTVFEKTSPFRSFRRVDAKTAQGPGVCDMKGGIVVGITALRALAAAGALDRLHVTFYLGGDEESAGEPVSAARAALVEAARAADIAIGLENADDDPRTAVIARRGSSSWLLEVTAQTGHSSQIFREDVGAGAIFEAARILNAFYEEVRGDPDLTFSPGVIAGGSSVEFDPERPAGSASGKNNIIASRVVVTGDLRALTPESRDAAWARMREVVARHLPHTRATFTFEDRYPPLAPTAGNERLLALYDAVSRDLGFGPVTAVNPRLAGAADISFVAGHVDMAIDGLGLPGGDNHTENEFADLGILPMQASRLAVLLYRLAGESP